MQITDMMRENVELRGKLDAAENRVFYLQGFSVEITTSLDILRSTTEQIVSSMVARAREHGLKISRERQETPEGRAEQQEAAQLIARLPANEYAKGEGSIGE